jgi:hypothetical protein
LPDNSHDPSVPEFAEPSEAVREKSCGTRSCINAFLRVECLSPGLVKLSGCNRQLNRVPGSFIPSGEPYGVSVVESKGRALVAMVGLGFLTLWPVKTCEPSAQARRPARQGPQRKCNDQSANCVNSSLQKRLLLISQESVPGAGTGWAPTMGLKCRAGLQPPIPGAGYKPAPHSCPATLKERPGGIRQRYHESGGRATTAAPSPRAAPGRRRHR